MIGKLSVGLSGVLIVALIPGKPRRTGGMNRTIPLSANLVIRNLGLLVFRMPCDEVAGIVAGACGNPAVLACSNKLAPAGRTSAAR